MAVRPEMLSAHLTEPAPEAESAFDATAESVYQTVLEQPRVNAAALTELMACSEVSVQFAVEQLASPGLITHEAQGDGWIAIEPEVSLAALLARQQSELARHQQQVEGSWPPRAATGTCRYGQVGRSRPRTPISRVPSGRILLARGVSSRPLVLDSLRNDKQAMALLSREIEAGAAIRTLPTLPARVSRARTG